MQYGKDLKRLDELIAGLGGNDSGTQSKGPCGLLLEHIQTARRHLLGAMSGEYSLSLEQAKDSLACISDKGSRIKAKEILQSLIEAKASRTAAI
jgi:hypothetical protein